MPQCNDINMENLPQRDPSGTGPGGHHSASNLTTYLISFFVLVVCLIVVVSVAVYCRKKAKDVKNNNENAGANGGTNSDAIPVKRGMAVGAETGHHAGSMRRIPAVKKDHGSTEGGLGSSNLLLDNDNAVNTAPRAPTTAGGSSNGLVYDRSHVTGDNI